MNRKAIISGREYTLLEIVPSLDGEQALLLCEDETAKGRFAPSRCGAAVRERMYSPAPVHAL